MAEFLIVLHGIAFVVLMATLILYVMSFFTPASWIFRFLFIGATFLALTSVVFFVTAGGILDLVFAVVWGLCAYSYKNQI